MIDEENVISLNAGILNKKSKIELDKLKWNDFKGLSKAQRQLLTGGARIRMAQVHKEHMLERVATRQPQYPKAYYDALPEKLKSMPIDDTDIRVGEGVTQKQQMRNIILVAKNIDHNFTKVISDISDEYIACARTGKAKADTKDPYSAVLKEAKLLYNIYRSSTDKDKSVEKVRNAMLAKPQGAGKLQK